ncbi:hypothetical protein ScPMuIL_000092 [Solemya velum]
MVSHVAPQIPVGGDAIQSHTSGTKMSYSSLLPVKRDVTQSSNCKISVTKVYPDSSRTPLSLREPVPRPAMPKGQGEVFGRKRHMLANSGGDRTDVDKDTPHVKCSKSSDQSATTSMASDTQNEARGGSKKERFEFFFGKESPFSQWHPCSFTVAGFTYNCAEQYMMHQKAILFGDEEMAKRIMASDSPKTQKAYGRKVSNFNVGVWNNRCVDIVKDGNLAKFSQNEELREIMVRTHPRTLVEAAPRDTVWGIGLGKTNPKAWDRKTWRGKNLLGFALTDVRAQIMENADT